MDHLREVVLMPSGILVEKSMQTNRGVWFYIKGTEILHNELGAAYVSCSSYRNSWDRKERYYLNGIEMTEAEYLEWVKGTRFNNNVNMIVYER